MNSLVLGKVNRVYLTDAAITTDTNTTVSLSVFDEAGNFVKDSGGNDLSEKAATWDATPAKFYVDLNFSPTATPGFIRLMWYAEISSVSVQLNDANTPADYELIATGNAVAVQPQAVPITYWLDNYVAGNLRADASFKAAIAAWTASNRRDMDRILRSAQGDLELGTKLTFFSVQEILQRDYMMQDFRSEWWMLQTDHRPIISVDSYQLVYGANPPIAISDELKDALIVNKMAGSIKFVPTTMHGNLFTALITNVAALGVTIMQDGGYNRLPALFRVTYTHGLDFPNLPQNEREYMRHAICRSALMKALPQIDPIVRQTSISKSIDGVSKSKSGGMQQMMQQWQAEEDRFKFDLMRKYGTHIDMVIS